MGYLKFLPVFLALLAAYAVAEQLLDYEDGQEGQIRVVRRAKLRNKGHKGNKYNFNIKTHRGDDSSSRESKRKSKVSKESKESKSSESTEESRQRRKNRRNRRPKPTKEPIYSPYNLPTHFEESKEFALDYHHSSESSEFDEDETGIPMAAAAAAEKGDHAAVQIIEATPDSPEPPLALLEANKDNIADHPDAPTILVGTSENEEKAQKLQGAENNVALIVPATAEVVADHPEAPLVVLKDVGAPPVEAAQSSVNIIEATPVNIAKNPDNPPVALIDANKQNVQDHPDAPTIVGIEPDSEAKAEKLPESNAVLAVPFTQDIQQDHPEAPVVILEGASTPGIAPAGAISTPAQSGRKFKKGRSFKKGRVIG